ncbi:EpsG family protein [Vibrio sp. 2-Bac 85]
MSSLYIYSGIIIILSLLVILTKNDNTKILVVFVTLTLSLGLRIDIGNDYEQYVNIFNIINVYESPLFVEPGFYFLNKISFYLLGEDGYYLVFSIYSGVTVYFLLLTCKDNHCLNLFILMFFLSGFAFFANNGIRQAAAIAVFIYSLKYLENDKYKFSVWVIVSSVILHFSAIFFLIFVFLPTRKSVSRIVYSLILLISFVFYKTALLSSVLIKLADLVPYYGELYAERITLFSIKEPGGGFVVIFWYAITSYAILHKNLLSNTHANIFIIGSSLYLAGIEFEMWERLMLPYFSLNILILSIIFTKSYKQSYMNFLLASIFFLSLFFLFSYQVVNNKNKNQASPYNHLTLELLDIKISN